MGFDHRKFRDDQRSGLDEDLMDLQKRRSNALTAVIVIAVLVGGLIFYNLPRGPKWDSLDKEMVHQGRVIEQAVVAFYQSNAEFPLSLNEVVQYFPTDGKWPIEPYNGASIHDTGSPVFNKQDSVGMVHYEKLGEEKAGYRLYVYGREEVLIILAGGYIEER